MAIDQNPENKPISTKDNIGTNTQLPFPRIELYIIWGTINPFENGAFMDMKQPILPDQKE